MGRWRRRTASKSGALSDENGGQSGATCSNGRRRGRGRGEWHNHPPFRKHELEHIRSYLHEYRVRAERVCFGGDGAADVRILVDEEDTYANPSIIAKHTFPALTIDILSAPYLDLPSSLTAKQRRIVHELCVELGLFHCGAGDRNVPNDRRIVVSIYYDGLEYVDNLSQPISVPVMRCLPWYYRNDHVNVQDMKPGSDAKSSESIANANNNFVLESTLKGRQAIEALIDQPGRCLRDAHDTIDFSELLAMDLSQDDVVPNTNGQQDAWMLVDTPERMELCVKEIADSQASEIALDLECYNRSKYEQATCLIQIHASGKDYVIDTLAPGVWDAVHLLEPLFGDQDIVKIGHSVTGTDVPSLHRDFGLFLVNCFDTYEAAKVLNLRKQNLAGLCEHYGLRTSAEYLELKKDYQNCDWRRRPLTEKMTQYGRHDAHFLVKLRKLMIRDLTRGELWDKSTTDAEEEAIRVAASLAATLSSPSSDNESDTQEFCRKSLALSDDAGYFTAGEEESGESQHIGPKVELSSNGEYRRSVYSAKDLRMHPGLMRVISLSQEACLKLWKAPREQALKNDAFVNVLKQAAYGTVVWNDCHTKLYQELVRWRDKVAEVEGTYPGAVCSLDLLVSISKKMPSCHPSLRQIDFFLPTIIADESLGYSRELLSIVASFRSDCFVSNGDKSVSAVLVRSHKDRVIVGRGEVEDSNASEEENEPTSSWSNDNVRRAVALVVVSTALGALAVFAMRSMKRPKR